MHHACPEDVVVRARGQRFCLATAMEQTACSHNNAQARMALSYFMVQGNFMYVLPFNPPHQPGRPSCFYLPADETKIHKDDRRNLNPLFWSLDRRVFHQVSQVELTILNPRFHSLLPLLCRAPTGTPHLRILCVTPPVSLEESGTPLDVPQQTRLDPLFYTNYSSPFTDQYLF